MKYCNHIPSVIENAHISFFIAENSEEYGIAQMLNSLTTIAMLHGGDAGGVFLSCPEKFEEALRKTCNFFQLRKNEG